MPVPAKLLMVVLTHIGGPFMGMAPPAVMPDSPPSGRVPGIAIADNVKVVSEGQPIRYRVIVKNPTSRETAVVVRLLLPSTVDAVRAEDATVVANAVAWKHVVMPGQTSVHTVEAVIRRPASSQDIEALACLHHSADGPPFACAADRNAITTPTSVDRLIWPGAILFGILAVISAVWLHRRINPELLTPANAVPPGDLPNRAAGTTDISDVDRGGGSDPPRPDAETSKRTDGMPINRSYQSALERSESAARPDAAESGTPGEAPSA